MRRTLLLASGIALVVILAFVAGSLFPGGFGRDQDPPCEDAETDAPGGDGCVGMDEACNAYGQVVRSQTVSCVARSADGKGVLRLLLAGRGRIDVTVTDGSGAIVLQRPYSLEQGAPADVPLSGKAGSWRLDVRFTDVQGDVRVVLWG